MTAPRLEGDVVLRPLRPEDAPAIAVYATSKDFFLFVPDVPDRLRKQYTQQDARAFVADAREAWRAGWPTWGIEHAQRLVGTIRIAPVAWSAGGAVGYGLHPQARGQGLATRALLQVLDWCRREGRPLPAARCAPEHEASQRVLRRCGFVPTGDGTWLPKP